MRTQRLLFCIFLLTWSLAKVQAQGITISGTIYDDGTESAALGTPTNMVGNQQIYANLSYSQYYNGDEGVHPFIVQASVDVSADGTYTFSNVAAQSKPSLTYRVSISVNPGVAGSYCPSPRLPNAIKEGAMDYSRQRDYDFQQLITIGTIDITNLNFSFNQFPTANAVTAPSQTNSDDATTLFTVPTLTGSDPEDGPYNGTSGTNTIAIETLPGNGTLYYNGQQITSGDLGFYYPFFYFIHNYDPTKLKVHPNPNNQTISFRYHTVDAAGRWSDSPATVTMPFTSALNYDYGDRYDPYNQNPAAHHSIIAGLHLGQLIDKESSPYSTLNADGDDLNGLDDEDGIISFAPLSTTNTSYSVTVSVLNSLNQPATLSGWIDFNRNGILETAERAQMTVPSNPTNTNVTLSWSNVTYISADVIGARFRLASNAAEVENPDGIANSGEVEDYIISVQGPLLSGQILNDANGMTDNTVNGSPWQSQSPFYIGLLIFNRSGPRITVVANVATDGTYSFNLPPSSDPYNLILLDGNHYVGETNDNYASTEPTSVTLTGAHIGAGTGSSLTSGSHYLPVTVGNSPITDIKFGINRRPSANDVTSVSQTNPLGTNQVQVPTLTGNDPEDGLYNGISGTNTVQIFLNYSNYQLLPYYPDHSWGTLYYNGTPVTNGQIIPNYDPAKLRVDPTDGNVTVGFYYKEVDAAGVSSPSVAQVNMPFTDAVSQIDFGDAPNSFKTAAGYDSGNREITNGARHTIRPGLQLGALIDAEADGTVSDQANGDNQTNLDDEDGVTSFPPIIGETSTLFIASYSVPVNVVNTTPSTAYLSGWIDWNNNGFFNDGEIAQATIPAGTNGPVNLTWTNQYITGPGGTNATYARFRLSTDATSAASPSGAAPDGEVEDYRLDFDSVLPVDLTYFEGHWMEGQGNQLNWSTAWERDNDHFEIQSSADAQSFESIGRLTGKGTTDASQTYSFLDAQPLAELTYYRLKQMDKGGHINYSKIIAIRRGDSPVNDLLVVYPNPSTDQLYLKLSNSQSLSEVRIYGVSGHTMLHQEKPASSIHVERLPAGVYMLEVKTTSGQLLRQRFIKQ